MTMKRDTDNLDSLVREAAGPPADPTESRRALRAAMGGALARRERRAARQRVGRTLALAVLLVAGLSTQPGSDSFDIRTSTTERNGLELTVYDQGLRQTQVVTTPSLVERGMTREKVEDLLMVKDSTVPVPVWLSGYRVGTAEHLSLACEYRLSDGEIVTNSMPIPGRDGRPPPEIRRWFGDDRAVRFTLMQQVDGISRSRAPDFTTPMHVGGLVWLVDGWRVKLPGRDEIVYLSGLRADGVRPQAQD
jgi:hypothetical protein